MDAIDHAQHRLAATEGVVDGNRRGDEAHPDEQGRDDAVLQGHLPRAEVAEGVIVREGAVLAIENWKSMVDRYLNYCKQRGLKPVDVTSFSG